MPRRVREDETRGKERRKKKKKKEEEAEEKKKRRKDRKEETRWAGRRSGSDQHQVRIRWQSGSNQVAVMEAIR